MGITQVYADFFRTKNNFKHGNLDQLEAGQICWVPTHFFEKKPNILEVKRDDPRNHFGVKYNLTSMASTHFKLKESLPVAAMSLAETEEFLVFRAKKRPCVFLCDSNRVDTSDISTTDKKHIINRVGYFLPLFSIQKDGIGSGFPAVFVNRIKVLMYPQFFYFKKFVPKGNTDFFLDESIGRFDNIFGCSLIHPWVTPSDMVLTDDLCVLLNALLGNYFKIPLSDKAHENLKFVCEYIATYYEESGVKN